MNKCAALTVLLFGCLIASPAAIAYEFLEKRECTLEFPTRPPVHTTCLIDGGMQGGSIDVSIKTPDGKKYPLEGPIDGEEGSIYLLQHKRAKEVSTEDDPRGTCYARNDGKLTICLGNKVD